MDNNNINLIPGLIQGITRVSISYPADVVKIHMQKQLFPSTFETIKYIFKNDKYKFYRGSSMAYVTISFERSLQFYYMEKYSKKYNPYFIGLCVSIASSVYNLPMQYLTTNIALSKNNNLNVFTYIKKNFKLNKIYTGYFIETPKNILGTSIYLGTYMKLRNFTQNSILYPFFGGMTSIIVWLIIYPLDTIKTEYQTVHNKKIFEILYERYKYYGIKSFYKGITPVLLRSFPSAFLGTYTYEKTRKILNL